MIYYKLYFEGKLPARVVGYSLKNRLMKRDPFHNEHINDLSKVHLLYFDNGLAFTVISDELPQLLTQNKMILSRSDKSFSLTHVERCEAYVAVPSCPSHTYTIYDFMCFNKKERFDNYEQILESCKMTGQVWTTTTEPAVVSFIENQLIQSISNRIRKQTQYIDTQPVALRVVHLKHSVKTLLPSKPGGGSLKRSVFTMTFTINYDLNTDLNWGQEVGFGFGRIVKHPKNENL